MKIDFRAASRILRRRLVKYTWTTSRQKWRTVCVLLALTLAMVVVPPFGIAVFGTAFAGWWLAVALFAVFGGLVGGHMDLRRELAALKREVGRDKHRV